MKIDLGCGRHKKEGYFGIDCQQLPGVDLVCDCNEVIPLPDNCADAIHAKDFLEHMQNNKRIHIMNEIWRLLKPNGQFYAITPDASAGEGAFQDPTHTAFWTPNSMLYYTDDAHRNLYGIKAKFKIIRVSRGFCTPMGQLGGNVAHFEAILEAVK